MLDINFIRQNPEKVKQGCQNKNIDIDISELLENLGFQVSHYQDLKRDEFETKILHYH